jgi:hypothetical protein
LQEALYRAGWSRREKRALEAWGGSGNSSGWDGTWPWDSKVGEDQLVGLGY